MERVIALLLTLWACNVHAQADNLEKYWNYRLRLDDQFLVIGPGQGMSIPADHRNNLIGQIKWSDATVDQGWYIGALATEHFLLSHSQAYPSYSNGSYGLEANTRALYYALKAMQRLDVVAETSFILCPGLPNENGFFIRDDVPINFHLNFPGMSSTFSDYVSLNIYDKEMSQDQMYHVLLGLSLVKRYVNASTSYNGENLPGLAVHIARKILQHVAGYSHWTIRNPACQKTVDRGPDAWSLAYGTNEMIKWITDGDVNYANDIEVILNEGVWPAIGQAVNPVHLNSDNTHMIMAIGAVGRLWGQNTMARLMNLATLQDFYLYPMLHGAIYGTSNVVDWEAYSNNLMQRSAAMLDEAPADGPASPQPFPGTHGWASANRFIRDRDDQVNGGDGSIGRVYHGVDYMLLHNLHYLLFDCPEPEFDQPPYEVFCLLKEDINLAPYGFPEGGTFSGPGILAGQFFNPSVSGTGDHTLVYTITGEAGCAASDSVSVTVEVCAGAFESGSLRSVVLAPNPAHEGTVLQLSLEKQSAIQLRVMDPSGRLSINKTWGGLSPGPHELSLELTGLNRGLYFIQVIQDGIPVGTLPLAVQ